MKKIILIYLFNSSISFSSKMVYVVNTKKYHIEKTCRTLKKSKNIKEISIKNIKNRTPCKICS